MLTDEAVRRRLTAELLAELEARGYAGVDVDFEYLPGDLAGAYADFLAGLRELLSPRGIFLWAALAPKTFADQPGLLYEGHSYGRRGSGGGRGAAHDLRVGLYRGAPHGGGAAAHVRAVLDYAVTEIPRGKILLGIPNYGYDWPLPFVQGVTRARSISNQEGINLALRYRIAIQFDESAQSPYFYYTAEDGTVHAVWFEDSPEPFRQALPHLRNTTCWGLASGISCSPFSQTC